MDNIAFLMDAAAKKLAANGIENAGREAASLFQLAIERDRTFIVAHPEYEPDNDDLARFNDFIDRRSRREPFHHIKGSKEFYGLEFAVSSAVLIPRPETEMLVEHSIDAIDSHNSPVFCEVGVGSGCISISILRNVEKATGVGLEISDAAISVAQANAERHGVASRFDIRRSDLFAELNPPEKFDLIVSNPPYVPISDIADLQPEVRDFEPKDALTDGGNGLSIIRQIVTESPAFLKPGGTLIFEIGLGQADAVHAMFSNDLWAEVIVKKDFQRIPRMFRATRSNN